MARYLLLLGLLARVDGDRRDKELVESLRRQLMMNNYDYAGESDSAQLTTVPVDHEDYDNANPTPRARKQADPVNGRRANLGPRRQAPDGDVTDYPDYDRPPRPVAPVDPVAPMNGNEELSWPLSGGAPGAAPGTEGDYEPPFDRRSVPARYNEELLGAADAVGAAGAMGAVSKIGAAAIDYTTPRVLDTTSAVTSYKFLEVRMGGGRRAGGAGTRQFLQEEGPDGVEIYQLGTEDLPFPEFRLPTERRQYMTDVATDEEVVVGELKKPKRRKHRAPAPRRPPSAAPALPKDEPDASRPIDDPLEDNLIFK